MKVKSRLRDDNVKAARKMRWVPGLSILVMDDDKGGNTDRPQRIRTHPSDQTIKQTRESKVNIRDSMRGCNAKEQ